MQFGDKKLAPYQGTKPFIFLSYSHEDAKQAQQILSTLNSSGYRVWYDEGLVPGKEFAKTIAQKVVSCSFFIALLSNSYLASQFCQNELDFARAKEKPRLPIFLEDVELPLDLQMQLGRLRAIQKYIYSYDDFCKLLFSAEGLELCKETPTDQEPAPAPPSTDTTQSTPATQPKPGQKAARVIGAVLLALAVLALIWWKPWKASKPAETTPSPAVLTESPAAPAAAPASEATASVSEAASSAPESIVPASVPETATPVSPLQLLKQAANADRLTYPEVSDCFSESAALYIDAPKGHSVEGYNSWSSSGTVIGYVYHGSRVRVLAEHGEFSCVLYDTEKNVLNGAWISTKHLTGSYPGQVWQLGDPAGASDAENRGDPAGSWSQDRFPETGTRYTALDEPVKNCVAFTLDYQLITRTGELQDVLGPRSVYVNDGSGWTWVGDFDYSSLGACHVEVYLDSPMDLVAVAAIPNVRDPQGFSVRQSLLDVKCR